MSYQPKVYKDNGGDRQVIASGGRLTVEEGGYVNFNDQDFLGERLRLMMLSLNTRTALTLSTDSKLTVSVVTVGYGYVPVLQTTAASTVSLVLPDAVKGAELFLDMRAWQSDISILSGTASLVFGHTQSSLSCIMIVNGSVNSAWLQLKCFQDDQWTLVNQSNRTGVNGQVAS